MFNLRRFLKTALAVGAAYLRPAPLGARSSGAGQGTGFGASNETPPLLPIRALGPQHRGRIERHLRALEPQDRYLRFGYLASDEQVARYVAGIEFTRDEVFGVFDRGLRLIAVAHLAYSPEPDCRACAEFGVSVAAWVRGRGFGQRLFDHAVIHARNRSVDLLFIHALSENTAMLKIARKAGASLERSGGETEAHLRLPAATTATRVSAIAHEQFARTDYRLKWEARKFWTFLAHVQEVRRGVRDGRHRSAA